MLPIIEGCSKNYLTVTTDSGKKKLFKSLSFKVDTGDIAKKAGKSLSLAAASGASTASKFLRRKYRQMKVKKAVTNMRKSLVDAVKIEIPFRVLKSRVRKMVHA